MTKALVGLSETPLIESASNDSDHSMSRKTITLGIRVGDEDIAKIDVIAKAQQIPPERTTVARVALQRGLDVLIAEIRSKVPAKRGSKRP